jgi:Tfp pilus assembly protein PilV
MNAVGSRASRCYGLTLPETLVALVGLAIVVLGIAAVHVERLQSSPATTLRIDAKALAEELAAVVRESSLRSASVGASAVSSNVGMINASAMTVPLSAQPEVVRFENPIGVTCRNDAKGLNAVDAASNQVACWQAKVAGRLPNGSGTIAVDAVSIPSVYVITVSWSQGGGSTASYVLRTSTIPAALPCCAEARGATALDRNTTK